MPSADIDLDVSLAGDILTAGEAIHRREIAGFNTGAIASGRVYFSMFTATKTEPITQMQMWTGTTLAAATPTLCRYGVYSVDAGDNLALITAIANDTTLFAASNTSYVRPLTATFNKVKGRRYAAALIVVSAAALPSFIGLTANIAGGGLVALVHPVKYAFITAQADLPANVLYSALGGSTISPQAVFLP